MIEDMKNAREIVTKALEARDSAKIKVRQPLQKLELGTQSSGLSEEYLALIQDEVNVKEVITNASLGAQEVRLDTTITDELKEEGMVRDLIREIQAHRKDQGLKPGEKTEYKIPENYQRDFVEKYREQIEHTTNTSITF